METPLTLAKLSRRQPWLVALAAALLLGLSGCGGGTETAVWKATALSHAQGFQDYALRGLPSLADGRWQQAGNAVRSSGEVEYLVTLHLTQLAVAHILEQPLDWSGYESLAPDFAQPDQRAYALMLQGAWEQALADPALPENYRPALTALQQADKATFHAALEKVESPFTRLLLVSLAVSASQQDELTLQTGYATASRQGWRAAVLRMLSLQETWYRSQGNLPAAEQAARRRAVILQSNS